MKKFLEEFKAFISKGNVLDLAVGVIIGGAFGSVVSGLTDNIIQPLLNCIGGAEVQGKIRLFGTENFLDYGAFISSIIHFLSTNCAKSYLKIDLVWGNFVFGKASQSPTFKSSAFFQEKIVSGPLSK